MNNGQHHIICQDLRMDLFGGGIKGKQTVLNGISFELEPGDRLAVIGPNGAGKSTLLKILAGILAPTAGTLDIRGETSALFNINLGTRRQSSGRRNMILRNLLEGKSMKEIKEKLPEMIDFADIGDYIDKPMEVYSQGMAMRVVFAAATMFDPEILLLDEWIGAGDMEFREKSRGRMNQLVEKSGIIVLATHKKRLAKDICNRGLYIRDGRMIHFGEVEDAWACYEEEFGFKGAPPQRAKVKGAQPVREIEHDEESYYNE